MFNIFFQKTANTPKYGLIFHSTFIGRAPAKHKGRISRFLANKCAIASRIDSFSDLPVSTFGEMLRQQVCYFCHLLNNSLFKNQNEIFPLLRDFSNLFFLYFFDLKRLKTDSHITIPAQLQKRILMWCMKQWKRPPRKRQRFEFLKKIWIKK